MWLDGLFMAEPFNTEYAAMFNKPEKFDEIIQQFLFIQNYLLDKKTGLYYHGWDESRKQKWADPETGRSSSFWGRANGWFMMAMVDVLDYIPENHPDRSNVIKMFKNLAATLLNYRDSGTKLWYQVVDQGAREGNYIETSSSLMFIYSYVKGVSKGYLPEKYLQLANESYGSVLNNFINESNGLLYLQNTVSVGGLGGEPYRDGSFEYYVGEPIRINDFKGYGALMFASVELMKLNVKQEKIQH